MLRKIFLIGLICLFLVGGAISCTAPSAQPPVLPSPPASATSPTPPTESETEKSTDVLEVTADEWLKSLSGLLHDPSYVLHGKESTPYQEWYESIGCELLEGRKTLRITGIVEEIGYYPWCWIYLKPMGEWKGGNFTPLIDIVVEDASIIKTVQGLDLQRGDRITIEGTLTWITGTWAMPDWCRISLEKIVK